MSSPEDTEEAAAAGTDPSDNDGSALGTTTTPGPHDVLCGRGGGTNNHPGNIAFRKLVQEHKLRYLAASKMEKPQVARDVVQIWRKLDPPGRFLQRKSGDEAKNGSDGKAPSVWHDVGDRRAREKASQCLRERTPDVMPYMRELQRHRDFITQQGLLQVERELKLRQQHQNTDGAMEAALAAAHQQQLRQLQEQQQQLLQMQQQQQQMNDADLQNAFSVEHFFTHSPFQNPNETSSSSASDPLSLQQMSQNGAWNTMAAASQQQQSQPQHTFSADLEPIGFNNGHHQPDPILSSNNNNSDELTLEEYMESMKQFKAYHLENDEKRAGRTDELLSMQDQSWIQSFHSVESNPSLSAGTTKSAISISSSESSSHQHHKSKKSKTPNGKSLDKLRHHQQHIQQQQNQNLAKMGQSTRTHLSAKSAMSIGSNKSNMSGVISLFSEDSRGSKMSKARDLNSNISMMSDFTELTDLSDALNNVDLTKE